MSEIYLHIENMYYYATILFSHQVMWCGREVAVHHLYISLRENEFCIGSNFLKTSSRTLATPTSHAPIIVNPTQTTPSKTTPIKRNKNQ